MKSWWKKFKNNVSFISLNFSGQAFAKNPELKDLIFEASQTNGSVARDVGQRAVEEWMDYRVRFGWSEFNSDTYGPIAFKALESVAVCADDLGTQLKSWSRINLHIFDHIIGSRYDRYFHYSCTIVQAN